MTRDWIEHEDESFLIYCTADGYPAKARVLRVPRPWWWWEALLGPWAAWEARWRYESLGRHMTREQAKLAIEHALRRIKARVL